VSRTVELTGGARRDLKRLDRQTQERVVAALERYAATGHGDVKRLKGEDDKWRLRVGSWRAIFTYLHTTNAVLVLRILPRDKAYR